MSRILVFNIPISQALYYAWFGLLAVMTIAKGLIFDIRMVLFMAVAMLSILLNNIPSIFQADQRLISFAIMVASIGPLFINSVSNRFKFKLFKYTSLGLVACSVLSFVGYLVHFPLFFNTSGFNGITNHSMTLSSISGISSVVCFHYYNLEKNKKRKRIWIACIIVSLLTCFLGGSRSALLAAFAGLFYYLWCYLNGSIGKFLKYLVITSALVAVATPIWYPYTENMRKKVEANEVMGGQFSSRETLWDNRVAEFESSPVFGIGFSSIDLKLTGNVVGLNGGVEPGSSWLFILSSTGLLGLLLVIFMVLPQIVKIARNPVFYSQITVFVVSILVNRVVHMFAEGYVLASGDFSFLYVWLCIATSIYVVNLNNQAIG